jgi:hypothetical protein
MTTEGERQSIRSTTETLCRRAAVLCTSAARAQTSLAGQRAQFAQHWEHLQAIVRQQRSIREAYGSPPGRTCDTELRALTNVLSRLRRPAGL